MATQPDGQGETLWRAGVLPWFASDCSARSAVAAERRSKWLPASAPGRCGRCAPSHVAEWIDHLHALHLQLLTAEARGRTGEWLLHQELAAQPAVPLAVLDRVDGSINWAHLSRYRLVRRGREFRQNETSPMKRRNDSPPGRSPQCRDFAYPA